MDHISKNVIFFNFRIKRASVKSITTYLVAIFLPCFLIGSSLAFEYKGAEKLNGAGLVGNGFSKEFIYIGGVMSRSMLLGEINKGKSWGKSGTEGSGGIYKFLPFHDVNSVLVGRVNGFSGGLSADNASYPYTEQPTNYPNQCSNNSMVHKDSFDIKVVVAQIIGTLIGIALGVPLVYYTQRISSVAEGCSRSTGA